MVEINRFRLRSASFEGGNLRTVMRGDIELQFIKENAPKISTARLPGKPTRSSEGLFDFVFFYTYRKVSSITYSIFSVIRALCTKRHKVKFNIPPHAFSQITTLIYGRYSEVQELGNHEKATAKSHHSTGLVTIAQCHVYIMQR